jgi:hypothetical protein
MTDESKHAREMHRAFRVLAQYNGMAAPMRNITSMEARAAKEILGHPLSDYVVACSVSKTTLPGSETDRVEWKAG